MSSAMTPGLGCSFGAVPTLRRELVHLPTGNLPLLREVLGYHARVIAIEGIEELTAQPEIDHFAVARARAETAIGKHLPKAAHVLCAALGDDFGIADQHRAAPDLVANSEIE